MRECYKKSELFLLYSKHVLGNALSIAGVSDNVLRLSILKEDHRERKESNQNYVILSGSF